MCVCTAHIIMSINTNSKEQELPALMYILFCLYVLHGKLPGRFVTANKCVLMKRKSSLSLYHIITDTITSNNTCTFSCGKQNGMESVNVSKKQVIIDKCTCAQQIMLV